MDKGPWFLSNGASWLWPALGCSRRGKPRTHPPWEGQRERAEVGENRHRSEAVLAADGGSAGEWIGIRMTHAAE